MENFSTINDNPRNPSLEGYSEYMFGIEPYINGLVNFLRHTTFPMTIALQGEWGSGKTSLMYKLREELCAESPRSIPTGSSRPSATRATAASASSSPGAWRCPSSMRSTPTAASR